MKSDNSTKGKRITFRLTETEDEALRRVARRRGVKVSKLIHQAVKRLLRRAA